MKRLTSAARKLIIGAIGFPLLFLGIILIPLPGPGILVCLLALVILSLEFEWAKKHRDTARQSLKKIIDATKDKQR